MPPMTDSIVPVRRALLSVSDKAGLVGFGRFLAGRGVEILSTGGTAKALRGAGVPVKDVSEHTGFPEILDGRVKTLVPRIHGGLLGRRDLPAHRAQMEDHGIAPIDLVAVNLYPFEATVAGGGLGAQAGCRGGVRGLVGGGGGQGVPAPPRLRRRPEADAPLRREPA